VVGKMLEKNMIARKKGKRNEVMQEKENKTQAIGVFNIHSYNK